jgi:excisionase family DNA binding protein
MTVSHRASEKQVEWPSSFRPRLSPVANEYVHNHPHEAERIVADALEAAAGRSDPPTHELPRVPTYNLPEALRRFVVRAEPAMDLLNLSEAADRLQVSRPTVYAWIEAKRMLAWPLTRRGTVVPAEQILGPAQLVPGIERVLELIPDPRLAWNFLTQELPFFAGDAKRPIDVLKTGDIDAVIKATRAYGEAFT